MSVGDGQPTGEQADTPFHHTHVYVQHKGLYIFGA